MEPVTLNNRYRLLELIGSGGMAVVYRGVDTLLQRHVAVKVLRESFAGDPAFLARFQREARAAARLDHPSVVTVYDVGHDGDRHYIVMEYVDGQDLKTRIRQKGRLEVDEALDIAIQVCAGVGHAHKAGIIHCDVKPQNVLVTHDGRVKVTDFGIARALSESGLTESETVWGSPFYFSPEQAAGDPPSPASDVYSIGVVIYEMLAGLPPFQAERPAALALMHMREEPPPLSIRNSQVPPQLEWIIRKVLAKEPAVRYRTAGQLAHVLEEYRKHGEQATGWQPPAVTTEHAAEAGLVPAAAPVPTVRTGPDRPTWILGAIASVAVLGLAVLWFVVFQTYQAYLSPSSPRPTRASTPSMTLTPEPQEHTPLGSTAPAVVTTQRRELTMPDMVDYTVEAVQEGLRADGLDVVVEEVWSAELEGMVLAQEPVPGKKIHAGETVTLTVSGGLDVPIRLEVNLADTIMLESAELRRGAFGPGDAIALTLRWRALRSTKTHYVVFVHLVDDPHGPALAQQDVEPFMPTVQWVPGVEVVDPHQVTIPANQSAGMYQLRVGMYPRGQPNYQLQVVDVGRTTVESGRILVAEITVD